MEGKSGWDIDVNSCSPKTLFELYQQLKESEGNAAICLKIKRRLVECMRETGSTNGKIVDILIKGVGSVRERREIAKEWSEALGITEAEFKRLANAGKVSRR